MSTAPPSVPPPGPPASPTATDGPAPRIAVIHNADVSAHSDPAAIRAALALQLHAPVRWIETVEKLAANGVVRALECGPGKVLCGMVKRIAPALESAAIGEPAGFDAALEGLRA